MFTIMEAEGETSLGPSPSQISPPTVSKPPTRPSNLSWDDVAIKLIHEKLLLTALELHTELVEAGLELPRLRDYFSNPANFEQYTTRTLTDPNISLPRSSSQTTLDSLDWGGLSEDGEGGADERVAVLEFELRKARQTIQALRANLTQATESKQSTEEREKDEVPPKAAALASIRPHEQRTLNFLINEYLVNNSYKLTAITFADENDDQDFEHWDDVGLNTSRPPNLVHLLRDTGHSQAPLITTATQTQTDSHTHTHTKHTETDVDVSDLQKQLEEAQKKILTQERELEKLHRRTSTPSITPLTTPTKPRTGAGQLGTGHTGAPDLPIPMQLDTTERDGRESPEGTSDNEDAAGGFVVVPSGPKISALGVEERDMDLGSLQGDLGSLDIGRDGRNSGRDSRDVGNVDSGSRNVDSNDRDDSTLSGYQDPSESIEVLLDSLKEEIREGDGEGKEKDREDKKRDGEGREKGREGREKGREGKEEGKEGKGGGREGKEGGTEDDEREMKDSESIGGNETQERLDRSIIADEAAIEGDAEAVYSNKLITEAKKLLKASSNRRAPSVLIDAVVGASVGGVVVGGGRVEAAVAALGGAGRGLVTVVADSLHNIAPNVILAKREVVVPLVVCAVMLHGDSKQRERLLHLLFNLIKRPDAGQRGTILAGLVGLARVLGPEGLEGEVLPQVWEQLGHKYPERRMLVAQSTAALAPYTPPALRDSLLLSMLLQILTSGGEKDTGVRSAALTSLALLVTFLEDLDKLPSLSAAMVQCLEATDSTQASPETPQTRPTDFNSLDLAQTKPVDLLVTALGNWALEAKALPTLLDPILSRLAQLAPQGSTTNTQQSIASLLDAITLLLPYLLSSLISTIPDNNESEMEASHSASLVACNILEELEVVLGEGDGAELSLNRLHQYVGREWFRSWTELDYLTGRVVSGVMEALGNTGATVTCIIESGVQLVTRLVAYLGPHLTSSSVVPAVLGRLGAAADQAGIEAIRAGKTGLTSALPLVYAAGVLGSGPSEELEGFITRHITTLSQCRANPESLQSLVSTLLGTPKHQEPVLAALWACVVHPGPPVRATTAMLWGTALGALPETQVSARVLPALVTLATDPDHTVRAATLPPLATTLTTTTTPQVEDKVWLQMEMLCDDPSVSESLELQLALPHTCCLLAHTQHTRLIHHFLLPRMCRVCVSNDGRGVGVDGVVVLGVSMMEAYAALTSCHLPDHVVAHFVLPALTQLQKTLGSTSYEHMETITDLIKEYTLRTQASQGLERRRSTLSLTGSLPTHPGVTDVKDKVSKMFSTTNTLHNKAQAINVSLPGFLKKK